MTVHIWYYGGCSTCKSALAWLKARDIAFTATDLVQTPPDASTLAEVQRLAAVPARKLFNVTGLVYRGEGWAERSAGMTDAAIHDALATNGRLIKRPLLLIEEGGQHRAAIGFREAEWQRLFG